MRYRAPNVLRAGLFFFVLVLLVQDLRSATLTNTTEVSPQWGPVGSQVLVALDGLDSSLVTGARLGAIPAPVVPQSPGAVTVTIPGGATSQPITLLLGGQTRVTPISFQVTRLVSVAAAGDYPGVTKFDSMFGKGSNQVQVAVGHSTLVYGWDGGAGPVLMAIATDADAGITLDGTTTGRALMFLTPLVYTLDSGDAVTRLQTLATLPEVSALSSTIRTEVQAGRDYTEATAFHTQLEAALNAYMTRQASPAQSGVGPMAIAALPSREYVARDLKTAGFELLDRVEPTEHTSGKDPQTGNPVILQKYGAAPVPDETLGKYLTANPLEWRANVYALDRYESRLNTRAKIEALQGSHTAVYNRMRPDALDQLIIGSQPVTRYADIVGLFKTWVGKQVSRVVGSATDTKLKDQLRIPDDEPGLYMVRAFSGARFPPQDQLLDNLPGGRRQHTEMLGMNIIMAVSDSLAFLMSTWDMKDRRLTEFLLKLEQNVVNALNAQAFQGTLDEAAIKAIFQAALKTTFDWIWDKKLRDGLVESIPDQLGKGLKAALKGADQVAKAFKVIERVNAICNAVQAFGDNVYTVQAVEDTLIVVGNPWAPTISGFQPQRGYRGTVITITGDSFSTIRESNIVTIGYAGTSTESAPAPARAEVVEAYGNSLRVRIPEDANTGIISVHVVGAGTASTANLEPPFQQFEVIPDPVLVSMDPADSYSGQTVRLLGQHFPVESPFSLGMTGGFWIEFTVNGTLWESSILYRTPQEIVTGLPLVFGPASVRIRYGTRYSNPINVTILQPEVPAFGGDILVSTPADNNIRDSDITLREALMLRAGTLSYSSLTHPPAERPPDVRYETDYVPDTVGPGIRNGIVRQFSGAQTIVVTAPLPSVSTWTTIDLGPRFGVSGPPPIIAGDGVAHGIVLDGAREVTLRNFTLTGFTDAALLITGGSRDNNLYCSVDGGAGDGMQFSGAAIRNRTIVPVKNVAGDGYHLTGPGVAMNELLVGVKPADADGFIQACGGWGIRMDEGARLNAITVPVRTPFEQPVSAGILDCGLGGILVTGAESEGNAIHPYELPLLPIADNYGPGIRIESPGTQVYGCGLYANQGSGIEVVGEIAAGSRINGCVIGGFLVGNTNHGIHLLDTRDIQIGHDPSDLPLHAFNYIDGNYANGILIQNSRYVWVRSTLIGSEGGNGQSGLVLQNSRDCRLGTINTPDQRSARLQITGHLNGSGIKLTGPNTHHNVIIGCFIGCEFLELQNIVPNTDLGNYIGIEIADGAWANRIGLRGRALNGFGPSPLNYIHYNRIAGVLIDSGGDPNVTFPREGDIDVPLGGNIVVNNSIQRQHEAGVILTSNAWGNRIGGVNWEYNIINFNGHVGVRVEGSSAFRPELGNRIIGNGMSGNGQQLAGIDLINDLVGVGVVLINAVNQQIGGPRGAEGNGIWNSWAAVVVAGGSNNVIANNNIDSHRIAGVLVRQSNNNQIGPGNNIALCGQNGYNALGGIALVEGSGHRVIANRIGSWRNGATSTVTPDALLIRDSMDNLIGGFDIDENVFVNATGYGVRVDGALALGNRIAGNWIGVNPGPGLASQPNRSGGVVIANGASFNTVGGLLPMDVNGFVWIAPVPNRIHNNLGEGVRVEGLSTANNSILDNSITANTGVGIFLAQGNNNIEAPSLTIDPNGKILGTSTALLGSLVQLFADTGGEGATWIGDTFVVDGAFEFDPGGFWIPGEVTATVTDWFTGDTSQFAVPVTPPDKTTNTYLRVTRAGQPAARQARPGAAVVELPLNLEVVGEHEVRVTRLNFSFTGSATSALAQAALFVDANKNGHIDSGDSRVGPILTQVRTNANFQGSLAVVEPHRPVRLLLVLQVATNASEGEEIELTLLNGTNVSASVVLSGSPISTIGTFPAIGDRITVSTNAPQTYYSWAMLYFSFDELPNVGAPGYDADGDGDSNLMEYFVGTHPRSITSAPLNVARESGTGRLTFDHFDRSDVTWTIKESTNLQAWLDLTAGTLLPIQSMPDGRIRETVSFNFTSPALFYRLRVQLAEP